MLPYIRIVYMMLNNSLDQFFHIDALKHKYWLETITIQRLKLEMTYIHFSA